jgi:hypothetical protein
LGTRNDWKVRRKMIAEELASIPINRRYREVTSIAQRFRVSRENVLAACKENRVKLPIL